MSDMDNLETMTEAELDAELRSNGIDPEQLIQNTFQKVCVALKAKSQAYEALLDVAEEMEKTLEAIVKRVALVSPYYEQARASLTSYAALKQGEVPNE